MSKCFLICEFYEIRLLGSCDCDYEKYCVLRCDAVVIWQTAWV